MTTKAQQIEDAIVERLQAINFNGYNSNAGLYVYRGRTSFTESDDFPLLTVVLGDSTYYDPDGNLLQATMPVSIGGVTDCDPNNPNLKGHWLLEDIKRAVLLDSDEGPPLGGLAITVKPTGFAIGTREYGSRYVDAWLDLEVKFAELYGDP